MIQQTDATEGEHSDNSIQLHKSHLHFNFRLCELITLIEMKYSTLHILRRCNLYVAKRMPDC